MPWMNETAKPDWPTGGRKRQFLLLAPFLLATLVTAAGSTAGFGKTQSLRREHDIFQQCLRGECGRDYDLCTAAGGSPDAVPDFNGPASEVCGRLQACAESCADRARSSY